MPHLKQYHLHKNDYTKLHFEINDTKPYIKKNVKHCFVPHQHSFYKDSDNQGFLFHFNDFFFHKNDKEAEDWLNHTIFSGMGKGFITLPQEDSTTIAHLTDFMRQEIQNEAHNYQKQVYFLFQSMLVRIERLKRIQQPFITPTDKDFSLVIDFKNLINNNLNQFHSLEKYSDDLHISSKKLGHLTKKYLGKTPATVIQERKILEAKRLLSNRKLSI